MATYNFNTMEEFYGFQDRLPTAAILAMSLDTSSIPIVLTIPAEYDATAAQVAAAISQGQPAPSADLSAINLRLAALEALPAPVDYSADISSINQQIASAGQTIAALQAAVASLQAPVPRFGINGSQTQFSASQNNWQEVANSPYTVPAGAGGRWLLTAHATITNSAALAGVMITVGGVEKVSDRTGAINGVTNSCSVVLDLNAGDVIATKVMASSNGRTFNTGWSYTRLY